MRPNKASGTLLMRACKQISSCDFDSARALRHLPEYQRTNIHNKNIHRACKTRSANTNLRIKGHKMGKFNEEQVNILVSFMTEHPELLQRREFCRIDNKERIALWKDLAERLNGHGPPHKSVLQWRGAWAKKKFEVSRMKKSHKSYFADYYADLYNLITKANEIYGSRSGGSSDDGEALDDDSQSESHSLQKKQSSRKRKRRRSSPKQKKPGNPETEEVLKEEEIELEYPVDIQWLEEPKQSSVVNETLETQANHKRSSRKLSASSLSSSSDDHHCVQVKQRKSCVSCSNQPEHSVDLFFKSLSMEVKNANLTPENLFTLEWNVLKTVSEKIKEFTGGATSEVQPSAKEP
ncbi:uncharacterized protein LOC132262510 [Phlebotomus argentipes]|uniref:uncharacterized protein LOC132262510 n=1 Tax=Phlebotomus argentipes TaxID=94469 RepID=UPI00289313C9|nr:uncharacterized protein LOC132262510 [Phlebotomus argentipes]